MSFIVAIEVAMPACGLFIIEEAIAARPMVVLAAGIGNIVVGALAAAMALAVPMTICAIVEEADVVLVDILAISAMLAMSIFAIALFDFSDGCSACNSQQCS